MSLEPQNITSEEYTYRLNLTELPFQKFLL